MFKYFKIFALFIFVSLLSIIAFLLFQKPSNRKDWVEGMDKNVSINFVKQSIIVSNFRQWRYKNGKVVDFTYSTKVFDPNTISKVYFLIEPFDKFDGIAHTYFLFYFENGENAAVSVEARREKGEEFSAFWGLFNKFELMYIWGDDEDLTGRRLYVEKNKVFKYPLKLTREQSENLFIQLANDTEELEIKPKFYNTLLDNCTNVLAKSANKAYPGSIPWDISWFLPGYSDKFLMKLNLLDVNKNNFNKENYLIKVHE